MEYMRKPLILVALSFLLVGCSSPAVQPTEAPIKTPVAAPSLEATETSPAATATEPDRACQPAGCSGIQFG